MHWDGGGWPQYVPVAERRRRAEREMARLRRRGQHIEPVTIEGRRITRTFWGNAWCEHLLRFASLASRLERGRSYVRNGSVCHLAIDTGSVRALVMGNELYEVELAVAPLDEARWAAIRERCRGNVGSLLDLLQGRLSDAVMAVVTDRDHGLFPAPKEFRPHCSCPDYTSICKHVAAVFYGVGARFDERPELLFRLRGVDQQALVDDGASAVAALTAGGGAARIAESDLGDVFGIDLAEEPAAPAAGAGREQAAGTGKRPGDRRGARAAGRIARREKAGQAATGRGDSMPPERFHSRDVVALRERLGLSRAELATLLGVSAAAVRLWETRDGPLGLQAASRAALHDAWPMSGAAARRRLRRR